MELAEGARVSLTGLKKRADVNGQTAIVLADAADAAGRWLVFVPATSEKLQVKPVNLGPAPEGESDDDEEEEEEEEEEGEEGEEEEDEEEEEDDGEEAREETVVIDYTPGQGRLGLDIEDSSLTVQGVAEDSAAAQGGLERFARWVLAAVGGVEVSTMEAAKVEIAKAAGGGGKKKKGGGGGGSGKLSLTFRKAPTTFVTLEELVRNPRPTAEAAAGTTSVEATRFSFRIPVDAPLNPGGSIQFRLRTPATDPSLKELHYLVNGKPRPPLKNLSFHLIGDHFARELRFPSLGTCMWLPAEGFAEAYAKLREMAEAAGLPCRGLPQRFNEEKLSHVEGIERDNAEERAAKLTMKKAKGVKNAKKRKIVKRAVAQEGSAAKRARKG